MSNSLDDVMLTLKYKIGDINNIVNAMNEPWKTPVILWANIIASIQDQCAPQIKAITDAAEKSDEPKATT
jgi:hypothetical protein